MQFRRYSFLLLLALLPAAKAYAIVPSQEAPITVVRALDKVTARVEELEINNNQPLSFGTLMITARTCRTTPPEETPESAAFLEISELKPGEKDAPVFRGWMFASSPALSAMEHPVYDIWLIGCKGTVKPADAAPIGTAAPVMVPAQPMAPAAPAKGPAKF